MSQPSGSKTPLRPYLRLLAYAEEFKFRVLLTWCCMALFALSTGFVFVQLKPIIDGAFAATGQPEEAFRRLLTFTIPITLLAAVLRSATGYGQAYLTGYIGQQVIQKLRNNLYAKFLELPMAYFNTRRTGELAAHITSDVQRLQDSVVKIVGQGLNSALTILVLAGALLYFDWQMALLALFVFPLAFFPIYRFGRRIRSASGQGQEVLADLNSQVHETLSGIRVVKAFGMEPHEREKFKGTNRKFFEATMRSIRAASSSSPIVDMIATVALLALILWLARRALFPPNDYTVGDFIRFFGITTQLYPHLKTFNGIWGGLQNAMASADRCFEVLDTRNPMVDARDAVEAAPLRKAIEFEKVSFEYLPGHPVLREVSFTLKKGEVVALVGPSGGGKTTLAELIPRFYQPTSGRILWDGKELSRFKLSSLRAQVGLVTQETVLFHESILKNIAYGRPGASFWDVQKAAQAAYAKEFIENSPQGFNTLIGERGVKLSGGQRQRLAIARALLKNPPVLILDEATSALDTESERLVQKALESLMGHRTTLVIAHRLSTVQKADRILVVERGRIVEEGRHSALLAKRGLYAKLYRMQFRGPAS